MKKNDSSIYLADEDWIKKGTWDLNVYNLEQFFIVIGTGINGNADVVSKWIATPLALKMPDWLTVDLVEYLDKNKKGKSVPSALRSKYEKLTEANRSKKKSVSSEIRLDIKGLASIVPKASDSGKRVLKPAAYDPDAQDGDGDGIVQEGTAWERPVGTRFFRGGREFDAGTQMTNRPAGGRLVDRYGKLVTYVPTYDRPDYKPLGTTVGEQVGNITEVVKKPKKQSRVVENPITAKLEGATGWVRDTYSKKIQEWLDSLDQSWRKIKGLRVFDPDSDKDKRIDINRGDDDSTDAGAKMFASHLVAKRMREKGIDFSKIYPSWEPVIDSKSGEVSIIQPVEQRDGMSRWLNPSKDWVRVDRRDPRYEELRSEGITSALIEKWAGMGDTDLQLAAGRFLGEVDSAGMSGLTRYRELGTDPKLMDAMIETMHEEAQKMLSDMGIDQMRLYRGMGIASGGETSKKVKEAVAKVVSSMPIAELKQWLEDEGMGFPDVFMDDVPIPLQPLSSFSTHLPVAKAFADNAAEYASAALVMSGSVPASRIVGIPGTGIGCFAESEFVVLTGDSNQFGVTVYPSFDLVEEIAKEMGIWEQMFPDE